MPLFFREKIFIDKIDIFRDNFITFVLRYILFLSKIADSSELRIGILRKSGYISIIWRRLNTLCCVLYMPHGGGKCLIHSYKRIVSRSQRNVHS